MTCSISSVLKIGFCMILILVQRQSHANAQNCGIVGTNETAFWGQAVDETAAPLILLWSAETYNVIGSVARSHAHFKYIWGIRFEDHYDYVVPDKTIFGEFPETERSDVAERYVTFNCADGGSKDYTFYFPIADKNTETPRFNYRDATVYYHVDWPLDQPLMMDVDFLAAFDDDFLSENGNLRFFIYGLGGDPNPFVTFNATLVNGDGTQGPFEYHFQFYLTGRPEGQIPSGILYADDGDFLGWMALRFQVFPNPNP